MSKKKNKWENEPGITDIEYQEVFSYGEHLCILKRNFLGAWCGYVAIPISSIFVRPDKYNKLIIHGGITWSDKRLPWEETESIDKFFLGFDCAHSMDLYPFQEDNDLEIMNILLAKLEAKELPHKREYRTLKFAKSELKRLVDQINK